MLKFLVLSDLHIVPEGQFCQSLDTAERLKIAVDFVNECHADASFVVFAGDLTEHGDVAAYRRFADITNPLTVPVYLTLGNHDNRVNFLDVYGEDQASETGHIDHVIDAEGYRIIVLDSLDSELLSGAGRISSDQLDWLASRLSEAQDRPVILVLHHNITKFHVQTDIIILENRAEFAEVAASHPDVRQVISGHVHMTTTGHYRGLPFCTLGGGHYAIDPELTSRTGPIDKHVGPRREGPGQLAVVLCEPDSVVVHMENYIDQHPVMAPELFAWD